MAGRTFRQTRPDQRADSDRVESVADATRINTGIVQSESTDSVGEDTGVFVATDDAQTVTDYDLPIDPTTITDNDTDRPRTRRRRADAGQPRGTRQKRVTFSSQGNLEKLLLSGHMMAAAFMKTPELRIDGEESAMLSKALLDVMKAYGIPELSDKQLAASQMIMALGTVYAPRIVLVMHRKGQKPKLVPPVIPFPNTQTVQQSQPPMPQPIPTQGSVQPATYGVAPIAPPAAAPVQAQDIPAAGGYISSQFFAGDVAQELPI